MQSLINFELWHYGFNLLDDCFERFARHLVQVVQRDQTHAALVANLNHRPLLQQLQTIPHRVCRDALGCNDDKDDYNQLKNSISRDLSLTICTAAALHFVGYVVDNEANELRFQH